MYEVTRDLYEELTQASQPKKRKGEEEHDTIEEGCTLPVGSHRQMQEVYGSGRIHQILNVIFSYIAYNMKDLYLLLQSREMWQLHVFSFASCSSHV